MRKTLRLLLPAVVASLALGFAAAPALAAPANDDFANAEQLTGSRGFVFFDLSGASAEAAEPALPGTDERSVWYRYAPTESGLADFSFCSTDSGAEVEGGALALYSGPSLAALSEDTHSTAGCGDGVFNAKISHFPVTANHVYWLQLGSTASAEIAGGRLLYDFNTAAPANDDLADAATITQALPQTIDVDNGLATNEVDEPDVNDYGPRNSVWYRWTADQDGEVSIDNCSSVGEQYLDSRLDVYTDSDLDPDVITPSRVAYNDDACPSPNSLLSHVYLDAAAGTTYFIRVSNYSDEFGHAYKLKVRRVGAPESTRPPRIVPDAPRLAVGESYSVSSAEWVSVPPITQVDLQWKRCDLAGDNCIAIDGATDGTYVVQADDVGHTLVVSATGQNGVESQTLTSSPTARVDDPPANDDFANATNLGSALPVSQVDDNYFGSLEAGEDAATSIAVNSSVWYRWTAPQTKTYLAGTCGSLDGISLAIAVYTSGGPLMSDLGYLASGSENCAADDSGAKTSFAATSGTTYWIEVGSSVLAGQAAFTLSITQPAAPNFTTQPSLSGAPVEGGSVSVDVGEWSSDISSGDLIVWALCNAGGTGCVDTVETSNQLELTNAMIGKRAKATVTVTNANGSASASSISGVIQPDTDGDGVGDDDDDCPIEAGPRSNGCQPSQIVNDAAPAISGNLVVGQQLTSSAGNWHVLHDPLGYAVTYKWQRCSNSSVASCADLAAPTTANYPLTAADQDRFFRVTATAANADDSKSATSAMTAVVKAAPTGGGNTTPPPPPVNPLTLTVKQSLGKLTPKKGVLTIKGAVVSCGASASGPCTGTITFSVKKGSTSKKYIEYPIWIPPNSSKPITVKLKSAQLKALKKAKSVKTNVAISVSAPGFAATKATSTATLKPQK